MKTPIALLACAAAASLGGAAFAQQTTASDAPAVAYATIYPLVMLLRVFVTQVIVFLLYRAVGG